MNSLKRIFDGIPIYWINLHDSTKRYDNMIKEFGDYNNNIRIDAIDGRNSDKFKNEYHIQYDSTSNFTTALIAVICSNIKAIKHGYDNNHEMICVIEDDAHFELTKYFPMTLKDIIATIKEPWDAIQLYHVPLNGLINYKQCNKIQLIKRNINYSGTCYLINRKGMKKILDNVKTDGEKKFIYKTNIIDPESFIMSHINTYVLNVPFIYYYDNESTISAYIKDNVNEKQNSLRIQTNAKNELINFYENEFINSK